MQMKKHVVVRDELKVNGHGLYAFTPFESNDKHGKRVFKVGLSMDISKRIDGYHLLFPDGVHLCAFLHDIPTRHATRKHQAETKLTTMLKAEKEMIDFIVTQGGVQIRSTTRIKAANDQGGKTELMYTSIDVIHNAFEHIRQQFGGKMILFDLNTNKVPRQTQNTYVGSVVIHY